MPFYLDSITTVFVVTADTAIKRSAWLIGRVAVLEEGVSQGIIEPHHISEKDMIADPYTKYLVLSVFRRLTQHYTNNWRGQLPDKD